MYHYSTILDCTEKAVIATERYWSICTYLSPVRTLLECYWSICTWGDVYWAITAPDTPYRYIHSLGFPDDIS